MSVADHEQFIHHVAPSARVAADIVSAGAIFGAFLGVLPPLAALGAIIWYIIQIYESDTVQNFLLERRIIRRRRQRVRQAKLRRLQRELERTADVQSN